MCDAVTYDQCKCNNYLNEQNKGDKWGEEGGDNKKGTGTRGENPGNEWNPETLWGWNTLCLGTGLEMGWIINQIP